MIKENDPSIEASDVIPMFPTLGWKIQLKAELHEVIDVKIWLCFTRNLCQLLRRGVVTQTKLLPLWRRFSVSGLRVNFVYKYVTSVTVVNYTLARSCVTGYDDGSIRCLEAIAERLRPFTMPNKKRFDSNVLVLIHDPRVNLMRVDFISCVIPFGKISLYSMCANPYILFPCLKYVLGHRFDPFRTINLKRACSADDPGSEDEIGIAHRMI